MARPGRIRLKMRRRRCPDVGYRSWQIDDGLGLQRSLRDEAHQNRARPSSEPRSALHRSGDLGRSGAEDRARAREAGCDYAESRCAGGSGRGPEALVKVIGSIRSRPLRTARSAAVARASEDSRVSGRMPYTIPLPEQLLQPASSSETRQRSSFLTARSNASSFLYGRLAKPRPF